MGISPLVHVRLLYRVADDLADPAFAGGGLFKRRPGKNGRGEEVFEFRIGIIVAAVNVPRLRERTDLEHHCKLRPFSCTGQWGHHGRSGSLSFQKARA